MEAGWDYVAHIVRREDVFVIVAGANIMTWIKDVGSVQNNRVKVNRGKRTILSVQVQVGGKTAQRYDQ